MVNVTEQPVVVVQPLPLAASGPVWMVTLPLGSARGAVTRICASQLCSGAGASATFSAV